MAAAIVVGGCLLMLAGRRSGVRWIFWSELFVVLATVVVALLRSITLAWADWLAALVPDRNTLTDVRTFAAGTLPTFLVPLAAVLLCLNRR